MSDARVSVIIPAYNAEACLARCVGSALSQEPRPQEVIVINDGSTDATGEAARAFGDRVVYLEQGNAGQGAARNAGLEVARGRFVAFLDADDYWLPGFLSTCLEFLSEHPEAVAVNTAYIVRRWGREQVGPACVRGSDRPPAEGEVLGSFFDFWAEQDHVRTGTVVIRRSVIEQAGHQCADLRISQDLEYWGYIATFGPWGFVPKPLWVGDSAAQAAGQGWLRRYRKRRSLCPTVEQWQRRIVPRLREEDWPDFRVVRGRVAQSFALNMILAGRGTSARPIVARYGQEMGASFSTNVMRRGNRLGGAGWLAACSVLRARELVKALSIALAGHGHPLARMAGKVRRGRGPGSVVPTTRTA
jgi:glycosyltransferase involved in cell wall biosynthesis